MRHLALTVRPEHLAICRLGPNAELPVEAIKTPFWSATRTVDELSLVLPEENVSPGWTCERGWRALQVAGPLDFTLTGVLSTLATPLAEAGISLFALSTYDTDYVLVRGEELLHAIDALSRAGHCIEPPG